VPIALDQQGRVTQFLCSKCANLVTLFFEQADNNVASLGLKNWANVMNSIFGRKKCVFLKKRCFDRI
jgi:hypothetical protein